MSEWIVPSEESGSQLLCFLTHRLGKQYSARSLKGLIERNHCQVNERTERFASTMLGKGDRVSLHLENRSLPSPFLLDPARLLFEDAALIVYDKPPGINSDEKGILALWKSTFPTLQLVHRLDRDTTGVLLLAKSSLVFEGLVRQFQQHQVRKRYVAIVDGITHPKGKIENYLGKKRAYAGQTIWGAVSPLRGLYACTEWERLQKERMASLITCYPKTGRTHQIRVHMAEIGHPVLGDFQYGKRFRCPYRPSRTLLHSEQICFLHPLTKVRLCFKAPLPSDFCLPLT